MISFMEQPVFRGPVFVVGLSRSGTKLLRDILNRHPLIGIPRSESFFIPRLLREESRNRLPTDLGAKERTTRFLRGTGFYKNLARKGQEPSQEALSALVAQDSWTEVVESVFRFYIDDPQERKIWGDKTPTYLRHMLLLKKHFPQGRFLHIYRDPRDRALSANKAWGANIFVAAQAWREGMQAAVRQEAELGDCLHSVAYEALTGDPEAQVRRICAFLGVDFQWQMLELTQPVEQRGDPEHPTRRSGKIVAGNVARYREQLTPEQLARIERLVFPVAEHFGYSSDTAATRTLTLGAMERLRYYPAHYVNGLALFLKRWGLRGGIRQALLRFRL